MTRPTYTEEISLPSRFDGTEAVARFAEYRESRDREGGAFLEVFLVSPIGDDDFAEPELILDVSHVTEARRLARELALEDVGLDPEDYA